MSEIRFNPADSWEWTELANALGRIEDRRTQLEQQKREAWRAEKSVWPVSQAELQRVAGAERAVPYPFSEPDAALVQSAEQYVGTALTNEQAVGLAAELSAGRPTVPPPAPEPSSKVTVEQIRAVVRGKKNAEVKALLAWYDTQNVSALAPLLEDQVIAAEILSKAQALTDDPTKQGA